MNNIDKQKNSSLEKNNKLDSNISKRIEESNIVNENRNKITDLAEKILLQPIKKGLESLKQLILPEKTKKEITEKLLILDKEKGQEKTNVVVSSKKTLTQFQKNITPSYYNDYAKKGAVEMAQTKAVHSLIQEISVGKDDPNLLARGVAKILNQIKRYS